MTLRLKFVVLVWLFVALAGAMVGYLAIFEGPFLSYPSLPFKVLGPARPGESVQLLVTRCNSRGEPLDYEVSHWLRNVSTSDPAVVLPGSRVPPLGPGCHTGMSAANVVPAGTPPGRYVVGGMGVVTGTLRTFRVPWYSEPFDVVEP